MQVCDSCSAIVGFLLTKSIHIGLKNGDWASVDAELCTACAARLEEMEKVEREHAILKSHKAFMEQMKGNEALLRRPVRRISGYRHSRRL